MQSVIFGEHFTVYKTLAFPLVIESLPRAYCVSSTMPVFSMFLLKSSQYSWKADIIMTPSLQMRTLRLSRLGPLAPGHIAGQWQSLDLNPHQWIPKTKALNYNYYITEAG